LFITIITTIIITATASTIMQNVKVMLHWLHS